MTEGRKPGEVKVLEQLNIQYRLAGAPMFDLVDAIVGGTSSALSTGTTLSEVDIVVGDPSEWLFLMVPEMERIFNYFDECTTLLDECLFKRVWP